MILSFLAMFSSALLFRRLLCHSGRQPGREQIRRGSIGALNCASHTAGNPDWAVSVSEPLHVLVLAGIGIRDSWRLWRGARVSPFEQSNILFQTKVVRWKLWVGRDFLKNVVTLPSRLWGVH